MFCLETLQEDEGKCQYFAHCKKLNYTRQNDFDSETTDYLEVRWVAHPNTPPQLLQFRHQLRDKEMKKFKQNQWFTVSLQQQQWKTISSDSKYCQ